MHAVDIRTRTVTPNISHGAFSGSIVAGGHKLRLLAHKRSFMNDWVFSNSDAWLVDGIRPIGNVSVELARGYRVRISASRCSESN